MGKKIRKEKYNKKFKKEKTLEKSDIKHKKILIPEVIGEEVDDETEEKEEKVQHRDMLEQIMFKLPYVIDPLIGTPKQVQKDLDRIAKKLQRKSNENLFNKIHLYMHGYLVNIVLKKFPFIKGLQTVDIYQETLIALKFKAIPNFKKNKGMSFLNFAKMCIRRHLITLLNASYAKKKDLSINRAVSIESSPMKNNDSKMTFANLLRDKNPSCDKSIASNEAYDMTRKTLMEALSEFEQIVLHEYLTSSSYSEIAKNVTRRVGKRYNTKSIDNALLRIRKKAIHLKKYCKKEFIPIFMKK